MNKFIKQTAEDYDLSYHIVESIYNKFSPECFYEKLEEEIKSKNNLMKERRKS